MASVTHTTDLGTEISIKNAATPASAILIQALVPIIETIEQAYQQGPEAYHALISKNQVTYFDGPSALILTPNAPLLLAEPIVDGASYDAPEAGLVFGSEDHQESEETEQAEDDFFEKIVEEVIERIKDQFELQGPITCPDCASCSQGLDIVDGVENLVDSFGDFLVSQPRYTYAQHFYDFSNALKSYSNALPQPAVESLFVEGVALGFSLSSALLHEADATQANAIAARAANIKKHFEPRSPDLV